MDEDKKVALILRWGKKVKMKNSYTNTFILGGRDFWTCQGMAWWPYSSLWRHLPYLSMLLLFPVLLKQQQKKITSQILKSTYSREFVPRLSQGRLAICFISFFFPLECYLKKKIGKPEVCGDGCEIPQCILNCKLKKTGYWVQQKNIFMPLSFLTSLMIWHAKARSFPQMALRVSFLQHSFLHVRTVI